MGGRGSAKLDENVFFSLSERMERAKGLLGVRLRELSGGGARPGRAVVGRWGEKLIFGKRGAWVAGRVLRRGPWGAGREG